MYQVSIVGKEKTPRLCKRVVDKFRWLRSADFRMSDRMSDLFSSPRVRIDGHSFTVVFPKENRNYI